MLEFLPEITMKFNCRPMELLGYFRLFDELAVMGALFRGDLGGPPGPHPFNETIDALLIEAPDPVG
jgi:hypothetical protein